MHFSYLPVARRSLHHLASAPDRSNPPLVQGTGS